jgi:endo-1,4-beta-xylanase
VDISVTPPDYQGLFAAECALLAPNFNWVMAAPAPDRTDLSRLAPSLDWAGKHGLALTGMHLLWHLRQPTWFTAITDSRQASQVIVGHATDLAARVAGQVYAWNVLNEDVAAQGGARPEGFVGRFGPAAVADAFWAARHADPVALLAINEYGVEGAGPEPERKRGALLAVLDQLLRAGAPIQAIGLQSHLRLDMPLDAASLGHFLGEIAARGLRILVTELDVLDSAAPGTVSARDQAVADLYGRYLEVVLAQPATAAVVTWGLSDRYTWLTAQSSARFARADGLPGRPLPFDDEFQPKRAYFAMLRAFEEAPRR